ncbi:MAG TPA: hypothetical protein VNW97_23745 [Candidatus Saccharimonadales bacterium]|jgi:hypothetical protein|nr:hypothetical protein [Candidatus Saccharimonadales bacterium]
MIANQETLSAKLRSLTAQIKEFEGELKSATLPDVPLLSAFRSALDNVRMTAWTASELLQARQSGIERERMETFVVAERVRRITEMADDLCTDIRSGLVTLKPSGMRFLSDGLRGLLFRLDGINRSH